MFHFWLSGLRAGIRGKSFLAVFVLGIFLIFVAYLSGSFSPRQPRTVALDIGLTGLRITLVLLNLMWIQELISREIDRKSILFSLTYPVSRNAYLFGRFLAVVTMSFLAMITLGLCLVIAVNLAGSHYLQEYLVNLGIPLIATLCGQFIDVAVVAAFAVWVSSVSTVPVMSVAIGLAFAIGGKALGATIAYLMGGADGDEMLVATFGPLIGVVRWLLPDLSRLDWRDWPMYGVPPDFGTVFAALVMAVSYAALMLLLAARSFRQREFS